jgi:hypothetical protein
MLPRKNLVLFLEEFIRAKAGNGWDMLLCIQDSLIMGLHKKVKTTKYASYNIFEVLKGRTNYG